MTTDYEIRIQIKAQSIEDAEELRLETMRGLRSIPDSRLSVMQAAWGESFVALGHTITEEVETTERSCATCTKQSVCRFHVGAVDALEDARQCTRYACAVMHRYGIETTEAIQVALATNCGYYEEVETDAQDD